MTRYHAWTIPLIRAAMKLRAQGMPYRSIAIVLREYHDFPVTGTAVRSTLRDHGAPPHPKRVNLDGLRKANEQRGTQRERPAA